ncbi:NADH-quinone oxidoreductase subunit N [Pontibacter sp. G13]|uniref:NADH-quinone oxidoreductase subunit N n=1 Tax=Pontibacter sp. G13 TaxID=3074898 RepID=UPI00288BF4D2|nr:NADH-quinone oxidoreductase subunit N [Pontibacter sp. G13]WNJ20390.1 NADH-quinone oxidoreductase subunit N [Pontibacter sp. G13]
MEDFQFSIEQLASSTQGTLPILILLLTGLILMLLDSFKAKVPLDALAAVGLAVSAGLAWMGPAEQTIVFFGMINIGGIAPLVHVFICLSGIFALFFTRSYFERADRPINDMYALLIFAVIGMILMANAADLIITFIGLETMSICLYIFASLYKTDVESNESGLKYFLLGAFASSFLLFGISLLYGLTGTTNLIEMGTSANMMKLDANPELFYVSGGLILIGFLFKVAAFPFHNWTPDVYQGTPTPLAGFMATGSKLSAFAALGTIINDMHMMEFGGDDRKFVTLLAISALFTMIYGNIVAARQTNMKRMLAYSSIAHSGYVLLGLCAGQAGFAAAMFYMFIYTLMNMGAFGMVSMVERNLGDTDIDQWRGLGLKAPYFAGAMAVFMFSLAGIPPLAGFMAKYTVFAAAIGENMIALAVIGILTSVIGAYYYIRVIVTMFFNSQGHEPEFNLSFSPVTVIGVVILAALILILGIFPSLVLGPIGTSFAG